MAENAVNCRFANMFRAFQRIDLDRSGTIDEQEFIRAFQDWGVNLPDATLAGLFRMCDHDGNGDISYEEFVDGLARDTVAPAAMGKRNKQSEEAMGVNAHPTGRAVRAQHFGFELIKRHVRPEKE